MVETSTFSPVPFLPNGTTSLPSPAPSTASSRAAARLPHPRSRPLARGSRKEDYARNYVSERLLHISRRYVKKHGIPDPADEVSGYDSMDEVCKDLEEVVDVLWFSGTPSLQIPYLLNVALAFNTYLPSFTPSPRPTFALLKKLDHCFASLILGRDAKSGVPLPAFQSGTRGFTRTDMVRCKSIADETRMLVATVMSEEPDVENFVDDDDDDDDDNGGGRMAPIPTRRNIDISISTGLIQTPIPESIATTTTSSSVGASNRIKTEDVGDFEADSDDALELEHPAPKRKSHDSDLEDEPREDKRTKVKEENDEPILEFSDAAPENRSPHPMINGPGPGVGQPDAKFHWMVDDDDDDDEESGTDGETLDNVTSTFPFSAPRVIQMAPDAEVDIGELGEDPDEDDEEEEELQLNVGKVYEKTLVQLGKSLGESIIDVGQPLPI